MSQSVGSSGVVGAGASLRPSFRIAAGPSGLTMPTTSGVAKSRNARTAKARRLDEAQARQTRKENRQRDRELEARKRRADAEMNAGAEAHMRICRPRAVEAVGIKKALGIPVGGAEQKADLLTLPQVDAGKLDVLECVAGEEMQRRVEPQQFFDRRGDGALAAER